MPRPRVFFDMAHGGEPLGRITIELFPDRAPTAAENFRLLCTGAAGSCTTPAGDTVPLHYKHSAFHRIIPEFMAQGGDITARDGTGGASTLAGNGPFADEALGWRAIDKAGLVCMANRGAGTNTSQFFITLDEADYLTPKHTCFGQVVAGMDVVAKMAAVETDAADKPLVDVTIANCGELEFRRKVGDKPPETVLQDGRVTKRRESRSRSRSRSRDHERRRGRRERDDRHHSHHHHRRRRHDDSRSPPPPKRASRSPAAEDREASPPRRRSRSPPPQQPRRSRSPPSRRDRYRPRYNDRQYDAEEEEQIRREELERENGRLDSLPPPPGGEVKFKGRGSMKYREPKHRSGGGEYGRLN